MTAQDDRRRRTEAAFAVGWAATICVFLGAVTSERLPFRTRAYADPWAKFYVDPWEVFFVAAAVSVYVMLTGWLAHWLVGWFARRDGAGRKSWLAYCKAGLVAGVPYLGVLLLLSGPDYCPRAAYWLAGPLSSLAYASIGYWLVERGWPWQWRRRGGTAK